MDALASEISKTDIAQLADVGFFTLDQFLPASEVRAARNILQGLAEDDRLDAAHTHRTSSDAPGDTDESARGDAIVWLDDLEAPGVFASLHERLSRLQHQLNRHAYLGLRHLDVQLARYPGDGSGYDRHLDATRGNRRRVTATVYLNPDWRPSHGGQLELFLNNASTLRLAPQGGRLVVFLSDVIEHAVRPAYAPRYAATAWYRPEAPLRTSI